MSIKISNRAVEEILKIKENNNIKHKHLRFGIKKDGVDGFFTQFYEFIKSPDDTDKVCEFDEIVVCMDQKSYMFLNGMTVDYTDENKGRLKFEIPEIAHMCGSDETFVFEDILYE